MSTTLKDNPTPDLTTPATMQPEYWIRGIPAPLIETFWHYAAPYVKRALDHANGEFDHTDFRGLCQNRDMQLWIIARPDRVVGAITTEIVVYPHRKHLRIVTLAGSEFERWVDMANATMDEYARAHDCNAIECFTRRGFVKKLEPLDYKMRHCVLIKDLT